MSDRRVHARWSQMDVVRYDRAGKWYLEPNLLGLSRQQVTLDEAVAYALWAREHRGGVLVLGLSGGTSFDRKVSSSGSRATATEGEGG